MVAELTGTLESWVAEETATGLDQFLFADELRKQGLKCLREAQYPTRKDEEWRYTPVKRILEKQLFSAAAETSLEAVIHEAKEAAPDARHLIIVDGIFREDLSDTVQDLAGLTLTRLTPEHRQQVDTAAAMVRAAEWSDENIFTSMSISLARSGLLLEVARNTVIPQPLHLLHIRSGSGSDAIENSVSFIRLAENAALTLVEQFTSSGQNSALTVPATFIHLADAAKLQHYKVSSESKDIEHLANTHLTLTANASASLHQYLLGSGLSRTNTEVKFAGPGAAVELRGIYLGEETQHLDIRTFIDHAQPYCSSDQHYRGILDDHSRGVFNGLVLVRPDAQHTDAQQSNKNLLLSDTARVDTKPQLEIYADDVKCAHGATVGHLDRDAVFYLQSRGISSSDARLMLTDAFTAEVTADIVLDSFREYLETTLSNRLNKLHSDHA